jgi:hypothetical protein
LESFISSSLASTSKGSSNASLNSHLKLRFKLFQEKKFSLLIQELLHDTEDFVPLDHNQDSKSSAASNNSRIQWLASEGSPAKALSVLNSSKVAQVNARSFNLMKEKHPEQDEKEDLWNLNSMDDHINLIICQPTFV